MPQAPVGFFYIMAITVEQIVEVFMQTKIAYDMHQAALEKAERDMAAAESYFMTCPASLQPNNEPADD